MQVIAAHELPRRVEATVLSLEAGFFVVTAAWIGLSLAAGDFLLRAFGLVMALLVLHAAAAVVLWRWGRRPGPAGRTIVYLTLALQVPAASVGVVALARVDDGAANFLYGSFGVLALLAVLGAGWMALDARR